MSVTVVSFKDEDCDGDGDAASQKRFPSKPLTFTHGRARHVSASKGTF